MGVTPFLHDASPRQLLDAAVLNQCCWFRQIEETSEGDAFRSGKYDWTPHLYNGNEAVIPFPRYDPSTLSSDLGRFMDLCRQKEIKVVSAWLMGDDLATGLTPSLLAQGFGSGGPFQWMALDLQRMSDAFSLPEELRVEIVEDEAAWIRAAPQDLPCRKPRYEESATNSGMRRSWLFGAWLEDRPVGHIQIVLTRGSLGVAGWYNLGVIPEARNQGIGKSLLRAACRFAVDLGCGYATVNTVDDSVYRELGFEAVGKGQTWWTQEPEIDTPPTPETVAFVEAVGQGRIETLNSMPSASLPDDLDLALPCGLTPLGIAAMTRQPAAAEWLLSHGATPDLVSLWSLGWKERIPEYLSRQPELINRRFSEEKKTPLHEAVWHDDVEFARFLLDHGADPTLEDEGFQSTPLGWAQYLGKDDLARFLEDYSSSKTSA